MPVKIRLARHGRKRKPFYYIVIADGRAPRDGRYIERIGSYNPNTNPATIDLNFDKALEWLQKGAQPTETMRSILSYRGVLYKNHLLKGVEKGAFTEEVAEERFKDWLEEKEAKISSKEDKLKAEKAKDSKKRLDAETKVKEAREAKIAERQSAIAAEAEAKAAEEKAALEQQQAEEAAKADETTEEAAPATEEKVQE